MEGSKSLRSSKQRIAEELLPNAVVNLSAATLVWLFGVLVFLPLAKTVNPVELPLLLSLVIFAAFTLFLARGLRGYEPILKAFAVSLGHRWSKWRGTPEDELSAIQRRFYIFQHISFFIIIYIAYSPILFNINPSINGLGIIITLLGIIWIIAGKKPKNIS